MLYTRLNYKFFLSALLLSSTALSHTAYGGGESDNNLGNSEAGRYRHASPGSRVPRGSASSAQSPDSGKLPFGQSILKKTGRNPDGSPNKTNFGNASPSKMPRTIAELKSASIPKPQSPGDESADDQKSKSVSPFGPVRLRRTDNHHLLGDESGASSDDHAGSTPSSSPDRVGGSSHSSRSPQKRPSLGRSSSERNVRKSNSIFPTDPTGSRSAPREETQLQQAMKFLPIQDKATIKETAAAKAEAKAAAIQAEITESPGNFLSFQNVTRLYGIPQSLRLEDLNNIKPELWTQFSTLLGSNQIDSLPLETLKSTFACYMQEMLLASTYTISPLPPVSWVVGAEEYNWQAVLNSPTYKNAMEKQLQENPGWNRVDLANWIQKSYVQYISSGTHLPWISPEESFLEEEERRASSMQAPPQPAQQPAGPTPALTGAFATEHRKLTRELMVFRQGSAANGLAPELSQSRSEYLRVKTDFARLSMDIETLKAQHETTQEQIERLKKEETILSGDSRQMSTDLQRQLMLRHTSMNNMDLAIADQDIQNPGQRLSTIRDQLSRLTVTEDAQNRTLSRMETQKSSLTPIIEEYESLKALATRVQLYRSRTCHIHLLEARIDTIVRAAIENPAEITFTMRRLIQNLTSGALSLRRSNDETFDLGSGYISLSEAETSNEFFRRLLKYINDSKNKPSTLRKTKNTPFAEIATDLLERELGKPLRELSQHVDDRLSNLRRREVEFQESLNKVQRDSIEHGRFRTQFKERQASLEAALRDLDTALEADPGNERLQRKIGLMKEDAKMINTLGNERLELYTSLAYRPSELSKNEHAYNMAVSCFDEKLNLDLSDPKFDDRTTQQSVTTDHVSSFQEDPSDDEWDTPFDPDEFATKSDPYAESRDDDEVA